ncbi:PKD domain-containing protein, partial [Bacteroidota bacterium]
RSPKTTITVGTRSGRTTFCSNDILEELIADPSGGTWNGPVGAIVFDTFFNPAIVGTSETTYDLTYTYTDNYGITSSKLLSLIVRPAPVVEIDKSKDQLCYPSTYNVGAIYKNADGVLWFRDFDSASGSFAGEVNKTSIGYSPNAQDLSRLYFWLKIRTLHPDNVCAPAYDSIHVDMSAIPRAGFLVDLEEGSAPLEATFTDTSTIEVGRIASWEWNFGDGNKSSMQNPVHTYTYPGTYTVIMTVGSNARCKDVEMKYVQIPKDVSIEQTEEAAILIYPNPADHFLTVKLNQGNALIQSVSLINSEGQLLKNYSELRKEQFSFTLSPEHKGMIYLSIQLSDGSVHSKQLMIY